MSTVQSVERAFSILQSLAVGPAGVSEVADRTGLPKSTVARLLSTLVEVGAVEQSELLGVYGLGEVLIDLSSAASPGRSLVAICRPYLVELVDEIGEAAGLGMLDGAAVYYYDQVDSDHEVQVRDWTGESVDAHVVSSGLVLMAAAPDDVREPFLAGPLERWTANTETDGDALAARLERATADGYAWVFEEMSEGLNSVAAPIVNPSGTVIAAVHAHGPSYRFPEGGTQDKIAAAVVETARRVSERLAGRHRPAAS